MTRARLGLRLTGIVQGVGFRPFVHGLARELRLGGLVGNDARGVFVEVEGAPATIETFVRRMRGDAPPLAWIEHVETRDFRCGTRRPSTSSRVRAAGPGGH